MADRAFSLAGRSITPGTRGQVHLPVSRLPTGAELSLPIDVLHGREAGPTIWLSGAIHGDEIVGVEIIRQVLEEVSVADLAGTIIAVPVVNVFGFVAETRYLPDRRDLNRSFPGSSRGSLAGQLARLFLDEVVDLCDIGLDFHAGSDDRTNLPQIRGDMDHEETRRLALSFGPPLAIHAKTIKGSLREAAVKRGKIALLFEGGEPRRFSPSAVEEGVSGTLRMLAALDMIAPARRPPPSPPNVSRTTRWVRAPQGGIFRLEGHLGAHVEKGERLGVVSTPSGRGQRDVLATVAGVVMGHAVNPLVHRGDGLVHIAIDTNGPARSAASPGDES